MTRQKNAQSPEGSTLWVLLDPETNNVLADGIDTDFLKQEILAGRLELEAGWDEEATSG